MKIKKITPTIGAEITGIDLSKLLQGSDYDDLYNVLMDHQVIFLRDQELTHQEMLEFYKNTEQISEVRKNTLDDYTPTMGGIISQYFKGLIGGFILSLLVGLVVKRT